MDRASRSQMSLGTLNGTGEFHHVFCVCLYFLELNLTSVYILSFAEINLALRNTVLASPLLKLYSTILRLTREILTVY